jgi:hypothetical protein
VRGIKRQGVVIASKKILGAAVPWGRGLGISESDAGACPISRPPGVHHLVTAAASRSSQGFSSSFSISTSATWMRGAVLSGLSRGEEAAVAGLYARLFFKPFFQKILLNMYLTKRF